MAGDRKPLGDRIPVGQGDLPLDGLQVFAVEDTAAQLTWSAMGADPVEVGVGPRSRTVAPNPPAVLHLWGWRDRRLSKRPGGPGSLIVEGLSPSTTYDVWVASPGAPAATRRVVGRLTTLSPPPGPLLFRFASVTDVHVGERAFGFRGRIREGPELGDPSALLCLTAAVVEARAWGAELIVERGDLTRSSRRAQFEEAARTLACVGVPAIGVLGNHDVRPGSSGPALCRANGLQVTEDVACRDYPGIRIVLAHSPLVGEHQGDLPAARIARIAELCAVPVPVAVVLHHPLDRRRWGNAHPPGVPAAQSARLAAALRAANPNVLVLAGHRHRHRCYRVGGITVAELGSTKDYPGAWAGYAVHEGGIRQVVRRVGDPSALAWTEATGRALFGWWAGWAPGSLEERCWSLAW
jgi:3',5'-cyclic-AMP phosphodiesterase